MSPVQHCMTQHSSAQRSVCMWATFKLQHCRLSPKHSTTLHSMVQNSTACVALVSRTQVNWCDEAVALHMIAEFGMMPDSASVATDQPGSCSQLVKARYSSVGGCATNGECVRCCRRRCCDGNCPPCEEVCNRKLRCGNHRCPATCHRGPCRYVDQLLCGQVSGVVNQRVYG